MWVWITYASFSMDQLKLKSNAEFVIIYINYLYLKNIIFNIHRAKVFVILRFIYLF